MSTDRVVVQQRSLEGYDVNNPPRSPHLILHQPLLPHSHSTPQDNGLNMGVTMDRFGEQHTELTRLYAEIQNIRSERDSLREELSRSAAELLHTKEVLDDIEHHSEPRSPKKKALKDELDRVQKNNSHLHKTLESRDKDIRKLKDKLDEQDVKISKQEATHKKALDKLESRSRREKEVAEGFLRSANQALTNEKKNNNNLRVEKKGLEKVISDLETAIRQYKREIVEHETTKTTNTNTINHLEKELVREGITKKERESDVRKAQESAFKMMMEPAKWMPKPDDEVRRALDRIGEELWSWTKSCIRKDIASPALKSETAQRLLKPIAQVHGNKYYLDIEDPRTSAKLPALICIATLTSLLYDRLFRNPFFWQTQTGVIEVEDVTVDNYQIYLDGIKGIFINVG